MLAESELQSLLDSAHTSVGGSPATTHVYADVAASCAKLNRLLDLADAELFWEGVFGSPQLPGYVGVW